MVTALNLAAGFAVTNETDLRGQAILTLVQQNIPGFVGRYYGFRPFGQDVVQFPAIMVECERQIPKMITTGKYLCEFFFNLFFFVTEDNSDAVVTLQAHAAESLIELFSNNKFKQNVGFWVNSDMLSVNLSTSFVNARPTRQAWMRVGVMQLLLQDFLLK